MLNESNSSRPIVQSEDVAALSFPPFFAASVRDVATGLLAMALFGRLSKCPSYGGQSLCGCDNSHSPPLASRHTAMTVFVFYLRLSTSYSVNVLGSVASIEANDSQGSRDRVWRPSSPWLETIGRNVIAQR